MCSGHCNQLEPCLSTVSQHLVTCLFVRLCLLSFVLIWSHFACFDCMSVCLCVSSSTCLSVRQRLSACLYTCVPHLVCLPVVVVVGGRVVLDLCQCEEVMGRLETGTEVSLLVRVALHSTQDTARAELTGEMGTVCSRFTYIGRT